MTKEELYLLHCERTGEPVDYGALANIDDVMDNETYKQLLEEYKHE